NLESGPPLDAEGRLDALDQPRPENWVVQVCLSFRDALDRVPPGHRAGPEPIELREDVPHPVRGLPTAHDLGEGLFVVALLLLHEAAQVMWIARAAAFYGAGIRARVYPCLADFTWQRLRACLDGQRRSGLRSYWSVVGQVLNKATTRFTNLLVGRH